MPIRWGRVHYQYCSKTREGAISAPISSKNSLKNSAELSEKNPNTEQKKTQFYHLIDTKWSAQSNPGGQITLWSNYLRQAS